MRAFVIPLAAVLATTALADVSPRRGGVNYKVFTELTTSDCARVWYIVPGAKYVANQSGNDIVLTDSSSGLEVAKLSGHGGGIHDGGFSANGKVMVTAGNDATVKIWDLVAMKEIRSIDPFGGYS